MVSMEIMAILNHSKSQVHNFTLGSIHIIVEFHLHLFNKILRTSAAKICERLIKRGNKHRIKICHLHSVEDVIIRRCGMKELYTSEQRTK